MTYVEDPASIGLFDAGLAGRLASHMPETLNEIGRLKWLHKWHPDDPAAMGRQQMQSANTLDRLNREASELRIALLSVVAEEIGGPDSVQPTSDAS